MGKDSLLKSTSPKKKNTKKVKKKAAAKKKTAPKKKAAAQKKAAAKKAAPKKSMPVKATAKKAAPPKASREAIPVSELIFKTFDAWEPKERYTVPADEAYAKSFKAPPFFSDPEQAAQLQDVMHRTFDAADVKAAGEARMAALKKAEAETKKKIVVPVAELIRKNFGDWKPETLFKLEAGESLNFSAPPFFDDPQKAAEVSELLQRTFDMAQIKAAGEARLEALKKAEAEAKKKVVIPISELIRKKFEAWEPETLFKVEADETPNFSAPPFFDDPDKAAKVAGVLQRVFDMAAIKAAGEARIEALKKAEAEAKAKKKVIPIAELIRKKFDAWQPAKLYTVPEGEREKAVYSAPPFFAAEDGITAEQAKELLGRIYDMAEIRRIGEEALAREAAEAEKRIAAKEAVKAMQAKKQEEARLAEQRTLFAQAEAQSKIEEAKKKKNIYAIAALVIVILLPLLMMSVSNSGKYYLKESKGAVEIWKGAFAPVGKDLLLVLHGTDAPEPIKDVYTAEDVYPLAFGYYLKKSEHMIKTPGVPDFEALKSELMAAECYATTKDERRLIEERIDTIDMMVLLYKADVMIERGSLDDLKIAKKYIKKATKLDAGEADINMAKERYRSIKQMIKDAKVAAKKAKAEAKARAKAEAKRAKAEAKRAKAEAKARAAAEAKAAAEADAKASAEADVSQTADSGANVQAHD